MKTPYSKKQKKGFNHIINKKLLNLKKPTKSLYLFYIILVGILIIVTYL